MSPINHLPLEIIDYIIKFASADIRRTKSRTQLTLVCRNWMQPAQRELYSMICIKNRNHVHQFIRTITTLNSFLGGYVKTLEINNVFDTDFSSIENQGLFSQLVKHCPNLEELKLSYTCRLLWTRLLYELLEGNWKYLNVIPYPRENNELHSYCFTAMALQNRIRKLYVGDCTPVSNHQMLNSPFDMIISRLKQFECLQFLDIWLYNIRSLFEYNTIIDSCSELEELCIHHFRKETVPKSTLCSQLDHTSIIPNLRVLRLYVVGIELSQDTLVYLMHKFPNLTLLFFESAYIPANSLFSSRVLEKFKRYTNRIDNLFINGFHEDDMAKLLMTTPLNE
ncbi:hypothetical protein CU098_012773 [Rhizopus stolonifer]|uniref:F-box domain-containing protein n=1 Tax=Rhizopus stolonifer TaxID=4846 RepID=A0A367KQN3_RHIST|nr:hypothetical protein CU098_012773 [Rhizopus stolonifer]